MGKKMPWKAEYHSGGTSSAQTRNPDKVPGRAIYLTDGAN
jgi:hypothetical protein